MIRLLLFIASFSCVAFVSSDVLAGGEYCSKPAISIERKDLGPKEVAKRCQEVASFLGYKALPRGLRCTLCAKADVRTAPGPGGPAVSVGSTSVGGTGTTGNANDALVAGYYVVKMSGKGFRKKRTDKAWRQRIGSAERRSGSEIFLIKIGKGGIKVGTTFASYVAKRKSKAAARSSKRCKSGPVQGLKPSQPDIWSQGPEFSLLAGPMSLGTLRKSYACKKKDSAKRSVLCNNWKVEQIAYSSLPGHCQ